MTKTGAGPSIGRDATAAGWGRLVEWLWRPEAMRRASADARSMDADARESVGRARTLAGLAERHLAEREPWTDGADGTSDEAVGVALTLYRDAAREAHRALGTTRPDDAPVTDARRELEAARASVGAMLDELARARGDLDPLRAQRFTRVGGLLVALAALAAAPKAVWYATHPDRAPDARWSTSSAAVGYEATGRGFAPPDFKIPVFFHTAVEQSPWVSFDLDRVVDVRAVTVVNRGDCCDDRAVPMVVEVSEDNAAWREVGRRTESFRRWELRIEPVAARWVRLRATQSTHLHLESVAIR
jgi:hypothetical protein